MALPWCAVLLSTALVVMFGGAPAVTAATTCSPGTRVFALVSIKPATAPCLQSYHATCAASISLNVYSNCSYTITPQPTTTAHNISPVPFIRDLVGPPEYRYTLSPAKIGYTGLDGKPATYQRTGYSYCGVSQFLNVINGQPPNFNDFTYYLADQVFPIALSGSINHGPDVLDAIITQASGTYLQVNSSALGCQLRYRLVSGAAWGPFAAAQRCQQGQGDCPAACPAGMFKQVIGSTGTYACAYCPSGTYSNAASGGNCRPCSGIYEGLGVGSTTCTSCSTTAQLLGSSSGSATRICYGCDSSYDFGGKCAACAANAFATGNGDCLTVANGDVCCASCGQCPAKPTFTDGGAVLALQSAPKTTTATCKPLAPLVKCLQKYPTWLGYSANATNGVTLTWNYVGLDQARDADDCGDLTAVASGAAPEGGGNSYFNPLGVASAVKLLGTGAAQFDTGAQLQPWGAVLQPGTAAGTVTATFYPYALGYLSSGKVPTGTCSFQFKITSGSVLGAKTTSLTCPAGTLTRKQPTTGRISCVACPPNTFSTNGGVCQPCPKGTYGLWTVGLSKCFPCAGLQPTAKPYSYCNFSR